MHARLSTYDGPAGLTDEQIQEITDEVQQRVMPKVRSMAGFKGLFSLYDDATGKSVSLTLWESADAMAASEADADTIRDEAAEISQEKTVSVERYRVTLTETV